MRTRNSGNIWVFPSYKPLYVHFMVYKVGSTEHHMDAIKNHWIMHSQIIVFIKLVFYTRIASPFALISTKTLCIGTKGICLVLTICCMTKVSRMHIEKTICTLTSCLQLWYRILRELLRKPPIVSRSYTTASAGKKKLRRFAPSKNTSCSCSRLSFSVPSARAATSSSFE